MFVYRSLSVSLRVRLFVCLSVCLSIRLFLCLSSFSESFVAWSPSIFVYLHYLHHKAVMWSFGILWNNSGFHVIVKLSYYLLSRQWTSHFTLHRDFSQKELEESPRKLSIITLFANDVTVQPRESSRRISA